MPERRNVQSKQNIDAVDQHEREKDYFTESEIDALLKAAKKSRYGTRDNLIILMMYRHGLRVSELINIRKSDLNLKQSRIFVNRIKNGLSVDQPMDGEELRAIKRYLKTRDDKLPWLFLSERKQPLVRKSINYIIGRSAKKAGLEKGTPHMLRHSCGYYLANKGFSTRLIQDYLGHRDIKHTAHYTRTAANRFEGLWR